MAGVSPVAASKRELRRRILGARHRIEAPTLAANATAISAVLRTRLAAVRTVAAYVPFGSEPGSLAALEEFRGNGGTVLLPMPGPDWGRYDGSLVERHWSEPTGARLGPAAVQQAELVIVPALAVDRRGNRLGRGGGFYDRVLTAVSVPVVALLHDGEVVDEVPVEAHDRPIDAVITPSGGWQAADGVDEKAHDGAP